jgi:hypothetical protein
MWLLLSVCYIQLYHKQVWFIHISFTNTQLSIDLFSVISGLFEAKGSNERHFFPFLSHFSFLLQINKMEHTLRRGSKGIKKKSSEGNEVGGEPLHMVERTGQLLDHWRARLAMDRLGRVAVSAIASLSRSSRESASCPSLSRSWRTQICISISSGDQSLNVHIGRKKY